MVAKVLVIEDEHETRELFLSCLRFEKFDAVGASSGNQGIELAKQQRPDVIVCDIMMPDIDGYAVLSQLREHDFLLSVPFIFLTAKVEMDDLRRGMVLGADDYLTKPCTVEQFLSAIATRLQRNQEIQRRRPDIRIKTASHKSDQKPEGTILNFSALFPDCPKLMPAFDYIDDHYQQPINLGDVAQAAGYTPAYLTNLCQSQTGRTVKKWITERRMAQARKLLKETAHSIRQIAGDSGYTDPGYFTRQFRKLHGVTPKVWRNDKVWRNNPDAVKRDLVTTATK
ncbi:MAG: response regulator [Cyanobacteria bacterium J06627_28]